MANLFASGHSDKIVHNMIAGFTSLRNRIEKRQLQVYIRQIHFFQNGVSAVGVAVVRLQK